MSPSGGPVIVQGDFTLLLDMDHPDAALARDALAPLAELVKSPDHFHTYRLSPLSVWNAAAGGLSADAMIGALSRFSRYPVPSHVEERVRELASRFGCVRLWRAPDGDLRLDVDDPVVADMLARRNDLAQFLQERRSPTSFAVPRLFRGRLKQALVKAGWPAEDLAGYAPGEPFAMGLKDATGDGRPFGLRRYQTLAAESFLAGGDLRGGSGVIVLPCGAGKTVVAMAIMARQATSTLVLVTGVTAARQWIAEILDKTDVSPDDIGEYTGESKAIRPITVASYQILTHRSRKDAREDFTHFGLFEQRNWGLVVYDEVHLLPAAVFQVTADLQAKRRLGLTATLVREDGREDDVFALIGPRRYDAPWKDLERQGWIAKALCTEVRVPTSRDLRMDVAAAADRDRFRVASENPEKVGLVKRLLARHPGKPTLVIGTWLSQLEDVAAAIDAPILTGNTAQRRRDVLFRDFREGRLPVLVVSKVANFAVDLPDAAVAIQVSGTFGSRQEEAQRLGRLLRPKTGENQAHFYALVSRDTPEQDLAHHRQLFLAEQGYAYRIVDAESLEDGTWE